MGDHILTVTVADDGEGRREYHLEHPLGCFGSECSVALHLRTFGLPPDKDPGTYRVGTTLRGGLEWARVDE